MESFVLDGEVGEDGRQTALAERGEWSLVALISSWIEVFARLSKTNDQVALCAGQLTGATLWVAVAHEVAVPVLAPRRVHKDQRDVQAGKAVANVACRLLFVECGVPRAYSGPSL